MQKFVNNKNKTVCILDKKDFSSDTGRGVKIDILFVPKQLKEQFLLSDLRIALMPCTEKIYYYDE
jgi:hypothetical protein